MKFNNAIIIMGVVLILIFLAWAPWMNNQKVHDKIFEERAHKDGTIGEVINVEGVKETRLICDYEVRWFPFGRWVASCEGAYFVGFWNG